MAEEDRGKKRKNPVGIQQRGPDTWRIRVNLGDGQRHFLTFHGSRGDAVRKRRELLTDLDKGTPPPVGGVTVGQVLDEWLDAYVKSNCSPRTLDSHKSIVERHLKPAFGRTLLKDLTSTQLSRYYDQVADKLSKRTALYHHRIMRQSLGWAKGRRGYISRNPADKEYIDAPTPEKRKMRTLAAEEVPVFLAAAKETRYYAVIFTALNSGLRQAELLALKWRNVDVLGLTLTVDEVYYKRRGVAVFKEPKTEHSRRIAPMTPELGQYLGGYRRHREEQAGRKLGLDELVFCHEDGSPLDPSVVSHACAKIAKKAGFDGLRFHDLRHTYATLALKLGISPKYVSAALGHSSVAFTLDTYVSPDMDRAGMARLGEVLGSTKCAKNAPILDITDALQ